MPDERPIDLIQALSEMVRKKDDVIHQLASRVAELEMYLEGWREDMIAQAEEAGEKADDCEAYFKLMGSS